ncbi:hypothetical protein MicloDRAFT_00046010 [Microvirga lotononidis]|uniref:DUF2293 domain-containing protein n=1 Tax=Microvirga lotononidis TaxID=864069 RepID=I4YVN2_9HYPH|nr:hypothetical protein MicloDRAFT_00046010 [Microvirga lotononidis]
MANGCDADPEAETSETGSPSKVALGPKVQRAAFLSQLDIYLRAMYPRCPPEMRNDLLMRAKRKGHFGRLGMIAGILATNHIRHELTDYEKLLNVNGLRQGLTRNEARLIVAAEVHEAWNWWRHGSAQSDPELSRITRDFKRRRRDLKRMCQVLCREEARLLEDRLISEENATLTDHLSRWINARRSPVQSASEEKQLEALQDEHHLSILESGDHHSSSADLQTGGAQRDAA